MSGNHRNYQFSGFPSPQSMEVSLSWIGHENHAGENFLEFNSRWQASGSLLPRFEVSSQPVFYCPEYGDTLANRHRSKVFAGELSFKRYGSLPSGFGRRPNSPYSNRKVSSCFAVKCVKKSQAQGRNRTRLLLLLGLVSTEATLKIFRNGDSADFANHASLVTEAARVLKLSKN